jgi:integrase
LKLLDIPGRPHLKKHPVTEIVYVRLYREGKGELFKSLKTKNQKEAQKIADLMIQDFLGLKPKAVMAELLEDIWPKWLATKDNKSKATLDSIANSWRRLKPYIGSLFSNEITPMIWEHYVTAMKQKDPEQRFFNDRKWFKMFIIWLHENGLIDKLPKLRNPDPTRSDVGKYITASEFKGLLDHANPDLQLQMLMAYTMGMRIGEIMFLTWGRDKENTSFVDLEKKVIHLHKKDTKIRQSRTFGISEMVYPELVIRHKAKRSDVVWPSPVDPEKSIGRQGNKTSWTLCRKNAGVKCRFHDLRHTFLTNAFKAGEGKIDSMLICSYAGLSIEQAQETYLHFDFEDTRAVSSLVTL